MAVYDRPRLQRLGIQFPVVVAPMVGISHVAFREWVRHYIPNSVPVHFFTEMISSRRLPSENVGLVEHLKLAEGEQNWIPQLLANEESFIAASVQKLKQLSPWGIDINMGCPVAHTLRHNWGVRLLGDADAAARVVSWTRKHWSGPLSVKLRAASGDECDPHHLFKFMRRLQDAGADWLTLHARTQGKKHRGPADWQLVAEAARQLKIPVLGNGDIQTVGDIRRVLEGQLGDGVMVARGIVGRPWLIAQLVAPLQGGEVEGGFALPVTPREEGRMYLGACLLFLKLCRRYFGEGESTLKKMRFFLSLSSIYYFYGHHFYSWCRRANSLEALERAIQQYPHRDDFPSSTRANL